MKIALNKKLIALEKNRAELKKLSDMYKKIEEDKEFRTKYYTTPFLSKEELIAKGFVFELLAVQEEALVKALVLPETPTEGELALCLFGKGKARRLRVMAVGNQENVHNGTRVLSLLHDGVVPSKYIFGAVIDVVELTPKISLMN